MDDDCRLLVSLLITFTLLPAILNILSKEIKIIEMKKNQNHFFLKQSCTKKYQNYFYISFDCVVILSIHWYYKT